MEEQGKIEKAKQEYRQGEEKLDQERHRLSRLEMRAQYQRSRYRADYDPEYAERTHRLCIKGGVLSMSQNLIQIPEYLTANEMSFLQFVIDDETGELHYITLPSSMASKSFNYYAELSVLSDDEKLSLGLVSEISNEMLTAINGLDFGDALSALMDKKICGVTFRTLKSTTGLDNTTVSNMKKGVNLNKSNVVSACLGIQEATQDQEAADGDVQEGNIRISRDLLTEYGDRWRQEIFLPLLMMGY